MQKPAVMKLIEVQMLLKRQSVQIEDEEQAEDEVIKTEQKEVDGKVLGTGGQYVQSYQEFDPANARDSGVTIWIVFPSE